MAGFHGRDSSLVDMQAIPYPAVTLGIDLGDGLVVKHGGGITQEGSVAVGLAKGAIRVRGRRIECLQVRLSPLVANRVLGACWELSETVVALEDLWGRDAARLEERLRQTTSWDERFAVVDRALSHRCGGGRTINPEVAYSWAQILSNRGQVRVEHLAEELGWSRKRLWARFREQVGCTPKRACQLVRFDHAAHQLAAGHAPALVAAECGYADQSHLHRDVIGFAGTTPAAVATAAWLAVDDVAWPVG